MAGTVGVLDSVAATCEPAWARSRGITRIGVAVVRPDRYVAFG